MTTSREFRSGDVFHYPYLWRCRSPLGAAGERGAGALALPLFGEQHGEIRRCVVKWNVTVTYSDHGRENLLLSFVHEFSANISVFEVLEGWVRRWLGKVTRRERCFGNLRRARLPIPITP